MEPITMTLAQWISGLRRDDVPADVRATLRLLALDTFACALAGRSQPWTRAVRAWALAPGSIPQAPSRIWGEPCGRLRAADAALVNGAAAHAFELDDFHNAKVHLGAVVVPAVFALAESLNAVPERIEAALAAGYEVVIRSSLALRPGLARLQGWHLTAVCGPLGAAAAASVLLGLDAQRTAWALGLAGTQSGGLFAFTADGASSKRFHPGRAAQAGVMAAELASLGLSGPTQLFEARDGGWLRAFSQDPDPAALIDGLGKLWHGAETNFKPYACCGSVHAHVDAALALRSRWAPGRGVRVGMPKVVLVQCGYEYRPGTALNAQMSGRYSVAAALLDGAVLPGQFDDARMRAADVVDLAGRLELVHDEALDALYPRNFCGWVEVQEGDGAWLRHAVLNPSGSAANPARGQAIARKAELLLEPIVGAAGAMRLRRSFEELDATPLRELLADGCVGESVAPGEAGSPGA
ncbi:MAG: MmgE/PrpD family protein [Achromobacter pulmonis]|nr:MmgE/PrpD family protein [Achromobacter sp.]